MHLPHACALETTIVAEDWSGRLDIRSELDGAVQNTLVERYRDLASPPHLLPAVAGNARHPRVSHFLPGTPPAPAHQR
nr:hypothetical protein [Rhodococcus jostii]